MNLVEQIKEEIRQTIRVAMWDRRMMRHAVVEYLRANHRGARDAGILAAKRFGKLLKNETHSPRVSGNRQ